MLKKITYGKFYTAIEHAFVNGKECYYSLTLEESKETFVIVQKKRHFSIEDCLTSISKRQPISLIINNQHTLFKVVTEKFETATDAAKFCFPTLSIEDFYIEVTNQANTNIVSICRKEIIEEILEKYKSKAVSIVDFSLGNNLLTTVSEYLYEGVFQNANSTFTLGQDHEIQSIALNKNESIQNYDLNGLEIGSDYLLGFASILGFYTKLKKNTLNFSTRNQELLKNYWQHRSFYLGVRLGVGFLFVLLLVNSFVFFEYQNTMETLDKDMRFSAEYKHKLEFIKHEIEQKKGLVHHFSVNTNSMVSLYLDEIGAQVPNSVLLTMINYQPLIKKPKEEKEILFDTAKMIISGTTSNGKEFTAWVRVLENTSWVKSCLVTNYGTGKQTNTSFTIQLIL